MIDKAKEKEFIHIVDLMHTIVHGKGRLFIEDVEIVYGTNWVALAGSKDRMKGMIKKHKLPIKKEIK